MATFQGMLDGNIAIAAQKVATTKVTLAPQEILARAILCNILVCAAVWMATSAKGAADKMAATLLPVTAFVACGYEHSVANMFLIPYGMICGAVIEPSSMIANILLATIGNVIGGAIIIALVLHFGNKTKNT